jgi:hypothetical protein
MSMGGSEARVCRTASEHTTGVVLRAETPRYAHDAVYPEGNADAISVPLKILQKLKGQAPGRYLYTNPAKLGLRNGRTVACAGTVPHTQ